MKLLKMSFWFLFTFFVCIWLGVINLVAVEKLSKTLTPMIGALNYNFIVQYAEYLTQFNVLMAIVALETIFILLIGKQKFLIALGHSVIYYIIWLIIAWVIHRVGFFERNMDNFSKFMTTSGIWVWLSYVIASSIGIWKFCGILPGEIVDSWDLISKGSDDFYESLTDSEKKEILEKFLNSFQNRYSYYDGSFWKLVLFIVGYISASSYIVHQYDLSIYVVFLMQTPLFFILQSMYYNLGIKTKIKENIEEVENRLKTITV